MKNELDMITLSHMYADSAILGLEVGRDVLGAPIEVRGGSNRSAAEMALRQRPRPT